MKKGLVLVTYRRAPFPSTAYTRTGELAVHSTAQALAIVRVILDENRDRRCDPEAIDRVELRNGLVVLIAWARRPHQRRGWDVMYASAGAVAPNDENKRSANIPGGKK